MKNIKSAHIIETIFSYTDDILKYKLFSYSKKYQKKLNIDLLDYQVKFFKMNSFNNVFKYLYAPEPEYKFDIKKGFLGINDIDYNSYVKIGKTALLKKDLLKYNINIDDFKNYVKNYIIKYKEKFIKEFNEEYLIKENEKDEEEYMDPYAANEEIQGFQEFSEGIKLEIDINSPLLDIFYKTELFGELFIIPINFQLIERYKLKEDYINVFNKLNDINSNYLSIFLKCNDNKDMRYLRDFNINFNKIKNLNIEIVPNENFYYNLFYRELFSLKDIENNIIDLYINNNNFYEFEIDENILENLNKFKKLENLKLDGVIAQNIFELKIKALKTLDIGGCKKIYINSDTALSLKKLIFPCDNISKSILKLPRLEYLYFSVYNFSSIDFKSLNNLKKIKFPLYREDKEEFTKILSIQSLKEIDITSDDIDYLDLASIHDKNPSVNKLIYRYIKDDDYDSNYNINEILNKFPNLTELIFYTNLASYRWHINGWHYNDEQVAINLEIKENSCCKINKICLILNYGYIKVYCQNFENLEKFEIEAYKILNISNALPIFSNNRNIIYNYLTELNLHLYNQLINLEIFKNLNNSIDNMPKLKKIDFVFMTNIDKNTYEEFIKKILSLKLEFININFRFDNENDKNTNKSYFNNNNNDNYSLEELKIINKNILYLNYKKIKIKKYPGK